MSLQGEESIFFYEWFVIKHISIICRRLSRDARWAYSFMLVHKENVNAYTMLARTEDEKNKWIEAIKEAYNNEVPPQSFSSTHEPVMTTFDKPTVCSYCNKMLKGLFYQGVYFFQLITRHKSLSSNNRTKLDWGSIRSSPRDGLSTP